MGGDGWRPPYAASCRAVIIITTIHARALDKQQQAHSKRHTSETERSQNAIHVRTDDATHGRAADARANATWTCEFRFFLNGRNGFC